VGAVSCGTYKTGCVTIITANGLQVHVRAGLRAETINFRAKNRAKKCRSNRTAARLAGTLLLWLSAF